MSFCWGARTYIMGIVNVTPDSFSGDGLIAGVDVTDAAVAHSRRLVVEGADLLDIGAQSTRPGSRPLSADEEMDRLLPVLLAVRAAVEVPISVDTYHAVVARQALSAGADWINDIWGLRFDPDLPALVAEAGCPVVIMHNGRDLTTERQGKARPASEVAPASENIVDVVSRGLLQGVEVALAAGIGREQIILDPGIGFGKSVSQNLQLVNHLDRLKDLKFPLLLGTSRKGFVGHLLDLPVTERVEGSAATVAIGIARGADIVRVHDVEAMVRVARVADALVRGSERQNG